MLTYVKYYAGDYDTAVFHLGFVASGFTIAVYGSPLATVVSNISNTSDGVSLGYPNTEKRVENMTHSGVFLTKFEVFGCPDETLSLVFDIFSQLQQKNKE